MADFKVTGTELVRDIPGNPPEKGGPAKVLKLSLEGDERQPELFSTARTEIPKTVSDGDMEYSDQWNRWQLKKKPAAGGGGGGGRGGFRQKMDPTEAKAVQRQHSQEMMLRLQALRGAQWDGDQMRSVINWFQEDIAGKDQAIKWDGYSSDVPFDDTGMEDGFDTDTPFSKKEPNTAEQRRPT